MAAEEAVIASLDEVPAPVPELDWALAAVRRVAQCRAPEHCAPASHAPEHRT